LIAVADIVLEAYAYHEMDNLEDVAKGALLQDSFEDKGYRKAWRNKGAVRRDCGAHCGLLF
jgi:hypothetical protein